MEPERKKLSSFLRGRILAGLGILCMLNLFLDISYYYHHQSKMNLLAGMLQTDVSSVGEDNHLDMVLALLKEESGSGVGLYLVREIVQKHYGTISVSSRYEPNVETVGETVFVIQIPI